MRPQGGQQDSVGGFMSGARVAASNSTLNAWMGRRQKSWMTSQPGASPSTSTCQHEKSGRLGRPPSRSQHPPPQDTTNPTPSTHDNVSPQTARPPNTTQPDPEFLPTSELGKQTLDSAAALPSPAPTDQPSPPTPASNQLQQQTRDQDRQSPGFVLRPSNIAAGVAEFFAQQAAANRPPEILGGGGAPSGQEASNTDDYSGSMFALNESDVRDVEVALSGASPSLQNRSATQIPALQSPGIQERRPSAASMPEPQTYPGQPSNPAVQNSSPASSVTQQPVPQQVVSQHAVSQQAAPPLPPAAQNINQAGIANCLRPDAMSLQLEKIVQTCVGQANSTPDNTTGPRLKLLKDAIEVGDYFYIALHQLLCSWSFSREWVIHTLQIDPSVADGGMKVVQNTLRRNDNMAKEFVFLFANFPDSPRSGLWNLPFYRQHIDNVGVFLRCLHSQWNRVLIPTMKPDNGRGYPILATELHYQLRLRSPVLEPVIFTVTRRHMGIADGPVADKMQQLFQTDLKTDYSRMSESDQSNLRDTLIKRYKQLVREYQSQSSPQAPSFMSSAQSMPALTAPTPMPSNVAMTPAMVRQQQMMNNARRLSAGYPGTQLTAPNLNAPEGLCTDRFPIGQQIPVSQYFNGSLRYRLRLCAIRLKQGQETVPEAAWAVAPTYWPDHISVVVNKKVMKIRRKQHNGQDQPVELTRHLCRGSNAISVSIAPQACARKAADTTYFMAVEVVETLNHQSIFNMVTLRGVIPVDSTRKLIQDRLKPPQNDGDDELAVVGSDLSIDLADPFSSTIYEIPVRGAACTHLECFDLGNWLNSRPSKPMCTSHGNSCNRPCGGGELGPEPSLVDRWKCPVCDGDARPYSLMMDSFMAEVRKKLEADRKLHTKTIFVAADGTWRPKVEEAGDDEGDDAEGVPGRPPAKRARTGPSPAEAPAIEIIELD
ncbi:Zinc finger MIZ domain-containing protein 1 [Colletotrichum fructicola]|nr:Zinc finger MIZ domain-containing protein 1 [Colletotrichum fructicola]